MRQKATITFFILSLFIFGYVFYAENSKRKQLNEPSNIQRGDQISTDWLTEKSKNHLNKFVDNPSDFTAIFLLESKNCAGCIIESVEYIEKVNEIDSVFFQNSQIKNLLIFRNSDSLSIHRFMNLHGINEKNVFYEGKELEEINKWLNFDLYNAQNQLLIIDNKLNQIHSIYLLNTITPIGHKEQLLSKIVFK